MLAGPTIREFEDGTEFTVTDFVVSTIAGAAISGAVIGAKLAYDEFTHRREIRRWNRHNENMLNDLKSKLKK